jgi:16S rRNA (guanine1207-N2)-methyltransferase
MHNVGQIIDRNLQRKDNSQSVLWINPDKDDNWLNVKRQSAQLKLFSQDHGNYKFFQNAGTEIEFSAFPEPEDDKYQWVILNLPRQKALLAMMLDCAASLLSDDGILWLAGENKAGIKSAGKLLSTHFTQVRKLDNARHCTLFEASGHTRLSEFKTSEYREYWSFQYANTEVNVSSYPGVFAHGRLDAGSALLLETLEKLPIEGQVLDFACGAGLIGAGIAANHPHAEVTLLDNNALALRASHETLAANQLNGVLLASDGLSEIKDKYDFVISNPPIHQGVKTDNLLSQRLLSSVQDNINAGGRFIMVANVHLPYENWLAQRFNHCNTLRSNTYYKIIEARM